MSIPELPVIFLHFIVCSWYSIFK